MIKAKAKSGKTPPYVHKPPIESLARRLECIFQESEDRDMSSFGAEILALEREIAENPATSLAEAAIQVMLAAAYVERVREDLVDDTEEALNKMERLIRSALSAVVREAGVDLDQYGGRRYAPSYTDPFCRCSKLH